MPRVNALIVNVFCNAWFEFMQQLSKSRKMLICCNLEINSTEVLFYKDAIEQEQFYVPSLVNWLVDVNCFFIPCRFLILWISKKFPSCFHLFILELAKTNYWHNVHAEFEHNVLAWQNLQTWNRDIQESKKKKIYYMLASFIHTFMVFSTDTEIEQKKKNGQFKMM